MTEEEKIAAAVAAKEQELTEAHNKALADKQREISQAQHTIVELKKFPKTVTPEIDLASIKEEVANEARQELEAFKIEQSKDSFDEILASFSVSQEEKEKIRETYDKSIVKTGFTKESIRFDLSNAFVLANKPRFESTIKELQQAAISKGTQSPGSTSSQPLVKQDGPNLSDSMKVWVTKTAKRLGKTEAEVIAQLEKNKPR